MPRLPNDVINLKLKITFINLIFMDLNTLLLNYIYLSSINCNLYLNI